MIHIYRLVALVVTLICWSFIPATAQDDDEQDFDYRGTYTYNIRRETDTSFSLEIENELTYIYRTDRVLSDKTYYIPQHSFDEVSNIRAWVNNDAIRNSNISKFSPDDEDVFIDDFIVHKIRIPDKLNKGDSVSYSYDRSFKSIAFMPMIRVPNYQSVLGHKIIFRHPANVRLEFESFFPVGEQPYKLTRPSDRETILEFQNLKGHKPIQYFPFNGSLALMLPKILVDGKQVNPTSPQEFSSWYLRYFTFPTVPNDASMNVVSQQVAAAKTNREKIAAIYNFVRSNVRYIADERSLGSIVPRPPDSVLTRRYGDCKDKAFLVASLARKFGLKVSMALVSTYPQPLFSGNVHVNMFNHAICAAEIDGSLMFFDPTCSNCEFGNLPESDIESHALIIDPSSATFVPAIVAPQQKYSLDVAIVGDVDEPSSMRATVTLRNSYYWHALHAKNDLPEQELRHYLAKIITEDFQKISLDSFTVVKEEDNSLVLSARADLSSYIISSTEKKYIPQIPFRMIDNDVLERDADSNGVYIDGRSKLRLSLDLGMKGLTGKAAPLQIGTADIGVLRSSFTQTPNGRAKMECEMSQYTKFFTRQKQKSFIDFCRAYLANKKSMVVITK